MAQIKKEGVRDAILEAAFRLFSERGYVDTSIPAIAREAGISTANVYVYFRSKLEVLYTLYEPWLMQRLDKLEQALARVADPQERFQRLLTALWRDLPRESNGFANNVMQALSTTSGEDYDPHLRELFQDRVGRWIEGCLPFGGEDANRLAGVLLMAFDGFAMNAHLGRGVTCGTPTLRLLGAVLLRGADGAGSVRA